MPRVAKVRDPEIMVPVGDRVLISPLDEPDTKGSIIIPENAKTKPTRGVILEVGPNTTQVNKGDVVVYGKYSGTDVELNGREVVLMHEDDVIAVVKER